ncbi:MAG: Plug domain-containing protein, partial [Paludibacteraceae bacterium]|nr:Plug domain-containing protein [Paludibacteraceae bacterium]
MKRLFLLLICISALFCCHAADSDATDTPEGYAEMSGSLNEVVVTASELKSLSSTSVIGRDAMQHLQPTNVGDLLELLPGGIAKDPALTDVNTAQLRETGTIGATGTATVNTNYMTNALGTLFLVDGAPINTDADMQYTNGAAATASTGVKGIANSGVDMRTISTDDIESVEVIRGIPSVEYGNLTSGVMNIKKIRRPTRLKARFKADDKSQLVSVGKGFALDSAQNYVMNIDGGFLNAYSDITNPLDNYKRANASVRLTAQASTEHTDWTLTPAIDYTGSFDNSK